VEEFIKCLDRITSARVLNSTNLLELHGHLLDMPDSKSLGKGLFELRTQGKIRVRMLYVFHKNRAYIIHGFVKKAWKISNKDIKYARRLQKEVMELA
jgi:phage-related protein